MATTAAKSVEEIQDSFFLPVPMAPPDAIFSVAQAYKSDPDPKKIDLSIGAYRDENGKPWVLPVVRKAEKLIVDDLTLDREYLPIAGSPELQKAMAELVLGTDSPAIAQGRTAATQTLSGTGALRVAAEFMKRFHTKKVIYVSDPTWGNHNAIFADAGLTVKKYRYYDDKTCGLDFAGMVADLEAAPAYSMVLLHACAHNPTGVDPTAEQWQKLCDLCQQKKLYPFFDCAYQGFVTGDLEKDASAVRMFERSGQEMLVCQSCSKNFGLYNYRTGNLTFVTKTSEMAELFLSQLKLVVRPMYSNPPAMGARVVTKILNNPELYNEWKDNLTTMSNRILQVRQSLYDALVARNTPGSWKHMLDDRGLFTYTGLTVAQCEQMIKKHHCYLLKSGRMSMCGVNPSNVEHLADAIYDVVKNY